MAKAAITPVSYSATQTTTTFRSLKGLSDALTLLGLVKSSDSGQVDWAAVTLPASGTDTVYEIRQIVDALTPVSPVFLKIVYRNDSGVLSLRVTIGTGSDGAGGLTGTAGTTYVTPLTAATSGADQAAWWLSGDLSGIVIIAGGSATQQGSVFCLERLRDVDGALMAGAIGIIATSGTSFVGYYVNTQTQVAQTYRSVPVSYFDVLDTSDDTLGYGSVYPFSPPVFLTPKGLGYTRLVVGYSQDDFVSGALLTIPRFSASTPTSYLTVKRPVAIGWKFGPAASYAYGAPAIYWED